jgi:hypothetical protein
VLRGTEFADYASIYDDAWNHILNAIVTANKYRIGVLLGKTRSHRYRSGCLLEILRLYLYRLACGPREAGTYRSLSRQLKSFRKHSKNEPEPRLSLRDV